MFDMIITLDYEMSVHRLPDVRRHLTEPTDMLLDVCDTYGAKLTIMVEIGELWAIARSENVGFSEHLGYDAAAEIQSQLERAIQRGHDVQLHLHPQWLDAVWVEDRWKLNYSKYRLPSLEYQELVDALRQGKRYLETLLRPHCEDYACIGFRAGNWITQPSHKYLRALQETGLDSDTSVFKWGYIDTPSVYLDYRGAHSNVMPWYACWEDINRPSLDEGILEFPIYTEPVSIVGLLSWKRLQLTKRYLFEDRKNARSVQETQSPSSRAMHPQGGFWRRFSRLFHTYPKKFDFCKLTGHEMLRMMERVERRFVRGELAIPVPIVLIGHSNEVLGQEDLKTFLEGVQKRFGESLYFATYREAIRKYCKKAGSG